MGTTPLQQLPLWARVAIEWLDARHEPPVSEPVPPGTLRLVRLAREGALRPGDLVATQRPGECEVTRILTRQSIAVRALATGRHHLIGVLDFGTDARVVDAQGPTDGTLA